MHETDKGKTAANTGHILRNDASKLQGQFNGLLMPVNNLKGAEQSCVAGQHFHV